MMESHRTIGDGEPDAESSRCRAPSIVHPIERPQNGFALIFRNSRTSITHFDLCLPGPISIRFRKRYLNLGSVFGVPDRVANDVFNRPIKQLLVA